jgi:hypothetical protein
MKRKRIKRKPVMVQDAMVQRLREQYVQEHKQQIEQFAEHLIYIYKLPRLPLNRMLTLEVSEKRD